MSNIQQISMKDGMFYNVSGGYFDEILKSFFLISQAYVSDIFPIIC